MKDVEGSGGRLREAKPPWHAGLVMVCRECDGSSKKLRGSLKDALAGIGARSVRVVSCSCLDLCPKRATAIVTVGAGRTECTIVRGSSISSSDLRPIVERFDET